MNAIRKAAFVLLVVGAVFIGWGHARFEMSHLATSAKLHWVAFPIIPGWALLIMGWIGVVGYSVWRDSKPPPNA